MSGAHTHTDRSWGFKNLAHVRHTYSHMSDTHTQTDSYWSYKDLAHVRHTYSHK